MSSMGHFERRLQALESAIARGQHLQNPEARRDHREPWQAWRFGVTAVLPPAEAYPTEESGADTFGVRFANLEFSPVDQGDTELVKHYRTPALVPARSLSGYVPEGTVCIVFWSKVPDAADNKGCWFIMPAGEPGRPLIRFRLTTSISVFGSGNGVRQKWDGADWIDDVDFPDSVVLFDYVGSASSGDPNDKVFAVAMDDHPDCFEIVEIQQSGSAPFIVFKVNQEGGITEDTASVDGQVITSYGAGLDPDDAVTLLNFPSHVADKYAFRRPNGYTGIALWTGSGTNFLIIEMEELVKVAEIEFICNQTVTTSDASFEVKVTRLIGDAELILGEIPEEDDLTCTVFNRPTVTPDEYVFTGSNLTSVGLGRWDHRLQRWDAVWITCPTGG